MAKAKKSTAKSHEPTAQDAARLYTLCVFLIGGPISEKFAKKNREISRTIQIRGDQTID